ncbi:MAG: ornithine cyclodeaminase family protein [Clostridia bacterium]|nr:ornithine cyclodeaminase family protein [Clostridia bacterium]
MLGTSNPEILFLQQEDLIKAGLMDMKFIMEITEETYKLFGQGLIKNPPKVRMQLPDPEDWISFFNTMPCYIGGDINIGGVKWAAESKNNFTIPGLPMGIDLTILSDPFTVLPFCVCDGTLTTAMRTSAVSGLCAKIVAPKNTKVATLIGAGVIGTTSIMSVCEAIPTLETIYLCDLDMEKAENAAKTSPYKDKVEIIPCADSKACCLKSQLIVSQTTAKPFIDKSWLPAGCGIVCPSGDAKEEVIEAADVIYLDYWEQPASHANAAIANLHNAGKLNKEDTVALADVILGKKEARTSEDQMLYAGTTGLGALDIMIAYTLYKKAMEMGIGTKVKLWDKPLFE